MNGAACGAFLCVLSDAAHSLHPAEYAFGDEYKCELCNDEISFSEQVEFRLFLVLHRVPLPPSRPSLPPRVTEAVIKKTMEPLIKNFISSVPYEAHYTSPDILLEQRKIRPLR